MSAVNLDPRKLLGFRLSAMCSGDATQVKLGAKIGQKVGAKTVRLGVQAGAKIGGKPS